ncbi:hypothetical protein U9M48_020185 [Paspalum notatum var. saurae]|uniref:Uncharacterized protein n=1 Tax=Paspalum notatum var. saurae TaxID=547442 RepID=A0AAQ3TDR5_PASNO
MLETRGLIHWEMHLQMARDNGGSPGSPASRRGIRSDLEVGMLRVEFIGSLHAMMAPPSAGAIRTAGFGELAVAPGEH